MKTETSTAASGDREIGGKAKTTRKQKIDRTRFALGGALLTAILAIGVNVASQGLNNQLWTSHAPISSPAPTPIKPADCLQADSGSFRQVNRQAIEIEVSELGKKCYRRSLDDIKPGDSFTVRVQYANFTGKQVDDVQVQAWLGDNYELIPQTTGVLNSTTKKYAPQTLDAIVKTGFNFGSYSGNGSNFFVHFDVRMKAGAPMPCGFLAEVVAARILSAPSPDNDWAMAGIVSAAAC